MKKKSKRPKKPSSQPQNNEIDFITNLPDPILHLILSSLPTTEEVVRTSILSRRWRYIWTSISSLDIDCSRGLKNFKKTKFKRFVNRVLSVPNQTLDLETFRLHCSNHYATSTVARWIESAVTRNVKHLHLKFSPRDTSHDVKLPECLTDCVSLVELRLFLFRRPLSLADFAGFPSLRVLELNTVKLLDDDDVESFLENCPLLEDLSLIDCLVHRLEVLSISCFNLKRLRIDNRKMEDYEGPGDPDSDRLGSGSYMYENEGLCGGLEVTCPKLVVFEYAGHLAYDFYFENLDSLKKAVVYPEDMMQKELSFESMGDTICELFGGVSHVESLSINYYFVQCIDAARDPKGHFPACLPNLKTLDLTTTIEAFAMDVLIRILKSSPNLESLHLIIEEEFFRTELWQIDDIETTNILTRHLKRVEFLEFNGEKQKLVIARFLLEHGNALEEMVFSWCNKAKYHEKSTETMKKMSKVRKASSTVKLITLLKDCSETVIST